MYEVVIFLDMRSICVVNLLMMMNNFGLQGASRKGKTPDGTSYEEAAEKEEIRALLR